MRILKSCLHFTGEARIFGCVTGVDGVTAFRYQGSTGPVAVKRYGYLSGDGVAISVVLLTARGSVNRA